jgi:hypothetical protein
MAAVVVRPVYFQWTVELAQFDQQVSKMAEAFRPDGQAFSDPRVGISIDAAKRLDAICDQFEHDLRGPRAAAIEHFLDRAARTERAAILFELLALELEDRAARHEEVRLDDYLTRFSEDREVVRLAFVELASKSAKPGSEPTAFNAPIANAETSAPSVNSIAIECVPSILADHSRYQILRRIGVGGMGTVYLAEHRIMERLVALKVIRPDIIADDEARSRFDREIKAAACLHHPNIVTAFDAERVGTTSILVMEYAEGTDLGRRLAECGPSRFRSLAISPGKRH